MMQTGPGFAGLGGILCLGVVIATTLSYLPPLPTVVFGGLLTVGVALLAFALVRSIRSNT